MTVMYGPDGHYIAVRRSIQRGNHTRIGCHCSRVRCWTSTIGIPFIEDDSIPYPEKADGVIIPTYYKKHSEIQLPVRELRFGTNKEIRRHEMYRFPFITYYGSQRVIDNHEVLVTWNEIRDEYNILIKSEESTHT